MTIFAVISGAESWEDIEDFGETHLDFLKQYGDFENGIPVHDTIARVVSCISPAKFHECGNDSNLLIVFYVQIMPDDFVMQLHRF